MRGYVWYDDWEGIEYGNDDELCLKFLELCFVVVFYGVVGYGCFCVGV